MTEAQAEEILQNSLIQRYYSNLEFLKENDLDLYNRINTFSMMIEENLYEEKFVLEFMKENGEFDILNLQENTYFYGRNAKLINEHLLNNADFSKKSTFCNFVNNLYFERDKDIEIKDSKIRILDKVTQNDISEYTNIWGNGYDENKKYEWIDKYFFFGNYLGTHLVEFQEKMKFKSCFIYEPNLEIFRLSLFVTDYKSLNNKSKIIFAVMEDDKDFIEKVNVFLGSIDIYSNYNIKNCQIIQMDNAIINKIFDELYLSSNVTFDYAKMFYTNLYLITKHINKFKILTTKKKDATFSISNNKPVLLLGAGPSLGKNIDWIKNNQNRFIIVAIGGTYKKLFDNGIIPDIVTTVDPQYEVLNRTHFNENDVKLLENTIVLASINTPTKILNRFNQEKLFLYEIGKNFKNNSTPYSGVSVGETSLLILLDMNIKDIYLLGTDLAFDKETGLSHYSGYANKKENYKDDKLNQALETGYSSAKEFIEVKGNKNDKVITNRMFALSINQYVRIINHIKKSHQNVYNLCEDGAFIEGTILLDKKDIACAENINKGFLLNNLEKINEFGLRKDELKDLNKKILNLSKCKKSLDDLFLKNKSINISDFNEKIVSFINLINKGSHEVFMQIILNYFNLIIPYVYYSLNDSKLEDKDKKNKLRQTEKVLYKQLKNLLELYEGYLLQIKKG